MDSAEEKVSPLTKSCKAADFLDVKWAGYRSQAAVPQPDMLTSVDSVWGIPGAGLEAVILSLELSALVLNKTQLEEE